MVIEIYYQEKERGIVMNNNGLDFVRAGLFEYLEDYKKINIDISQFRWVVGDDYIDIIGDSSVEENNYDNAEDNADDNVNNNTDDNINNNAENKVKNKYVGDIFYEIKLNKNDCFVVEDLRAIYKGNVNVISTYPDYVINQENGNVEVKSEDITNEAYINAMKLMMVEEKKHIKNSNYGTRIIMEIINDELIVIKLICIKDYFCMRSGEIHTPCGGAADIKDLVGIKEKTPFDGWDFYSQLSYVDAVDMKCKISYTKYGQQEECVEICDRYTKGEDAISTIAAINKEIEKHDLETISFEKFGIDIYKMDELAGYFAIEDFFEHDMYSQEYKEGTYRLLSGSDSFYEILHKQNTLMEYCEKLKSFFCSISLEKIVQAYMELKKNPDKDLLDIFHTVYKGRFRTKYIEGISESFSDEINEDVYYKEEGPYKSHLYRNNQVYLGAIYQERVDQKENINDAYIILFTEREFYQKGKEILRSHQLPHKLFDDEGEVGDKAYKKICKGESIDVPLAIMKNNTYISKKDGKKYMHAWSDMVRIVRVIGKNQKGMLVTEYVGRHES